MAAAIVGVLAVAECSLRPRLKQMQVNRDALVIYIFHGLAMTIMNNPGPDSSMSKKSHAPLICKVRPVVDIETLRYIPNIVIKQPLVGNQVSNRGFTVIELIVTVTIAAILLTLTVPSMRTFIQNARITNQNNDFVSDLNFARTEAIKRAANVTLCKSADSTVAAPTCSTVGSDWGIGRIIFIDSNLDGDYDNTEVLLRIREPLDGGNTLTVNDTSAGGTDARNLVVYTGAATTTLGTAQTATFNLCDERGAAFGRAISFGFRGKVTMTKPPAACS